MNKNELPGERFVEGRLATVWRDEHHCLYVPGRFKRVHTVCYQGT